MPDPENKMEDILSEETKVDIPATPEAGTPSPAETEQTPGGAGEKPEDQTSKPEAAPAADIAKEIAERDRQIKGLIGDIAKERGDRKALKAELATLKQQMADILKKITPEQKSLLDEIADDDATPLTRADLKRLAREAESKKAIQQPDEAPVEVDPEAQSKIQETNERWDKSFEVVKVLPNAKEYMEAALIAAQKDPGLKEKVRQSAEPAKVLYEYGQGLSAKPAVKPAVTVVSTGGGSPGAPPPKSLNDLYRKAGKQ